MSRSETFVKCPKCLEEKFHIFAWNDFGSHYQPPDAGFEVSQECDCNISEEEMDRYTDLLMEMSTREDNIGHHELEMVRIESDTSCYESSYSEEELEKMMKHHDSIPEKIEKEYKQYEVLRREFYGKNYNKVIE